MSRIIMFIPIDSTTNISNISSGILYAIKQRNTKLNMCQLSLKNFVIDNINQSEENFHIPDESIYKSCVRCLIHGTSEFFLKEVTSKIYKIKKDKDIILINGIESVKHCCSIFELNYKVACILNAEIILVASIENHFLRKFEKKMQLIQCNKKISGIIFNKIENIFNIGGNSILENKSTYKEIDDIYIEDKINQLNKGSVSIIGIIPWNLKVLNIKILDIIKNLNVKILNKVECIANKIQSIVFVTNNIFGILKKISSSCLLVISFYNFKKFYRYIKNTNVIAILLTNSLEEKLNIDKLFIFNKICDLLIMYTRKNIFDIANDFKSLKFNRIVFEEQKKINLENYISHFINKNWIQSISYSKNFSINKKNFISSSSYFFYNRISELAYYANKNIILPEGDEPRTILAASICSEKKIAKCTLLGNLDRIYKIAKLHQINLKKVRIIDPEKIRDNYVNRLVELRKNKGITFENALRILKKDNITLGMLMLEKNEVDGLVSGAVHATAKVIRPSLQIIKMFPGTTLVSSIFFMLLPEQILIYGDCAVNPDPTSEQLAEIAIQSAESASYFGIDPYIAMISYSTGCSGSGKDVDKVKEATRIVKKRRPDLLIDGPLQYDAATVKEVALIKSPKSSVAGRATVLIFPDLNTGNTVYKAVQRTANINAIGPILQGMKKPVNDLSRGALVSDIVYTIAVTAIQSQQIEEKLSFLNKN